MYRDMSRELVTYRFEGFPAGRLVHAVFTRLGGVSKPPFDTLNVGNSVGDDPAATAENHARICQHLGIGQEHIATAQQVHGNHVAVVGREDGGHIRPQTDALVTSCPDLALMLRFADCQPILLYDPACHALGLVHAGWRGLAQGMARRAVEAMQRAFGSDPGNLLAALGPAVGPCCYEVGDNVATAMGYALPSWRKVLARDGSRWRLDLPAANAQQLADTGVRAIEEAGICTRCNSEEFFSHRASNGLTGRFAVLAYLLPTEDGARPLLPKEQAGLPPGGSGVPASIHPAGFPSFGGFAAVDSDDAHGTEEQP